MAKPDKLAAEIEAAEKEIFRNPEADAPAPVSASEEAVAKVSYFRGLIELSNS